MQFFGALTLSLCVGNFNKVWISEQNYKAFSPLCLYRIMSTVPWHSEPWWRPHFANAVSSLLFWSPASGSGFWRALRLPISLCVALLSRFLTIHPYSRAEVLLTFLAYINRKSFWLLSDEDKAV